MAALSKDIPIDGDSEHVSKSTSEVSIDPSLLPDPTSDLHWSAWRGAIHDIFHQNALKHPDRACIIETAGRQFTYRQIDEASNILAHHLLQSGVQRNEVVMVYAHRGVDLVVAVMGVLKAGATFSVIDPAYPPDRQNIYLDVARPRALVVIEKATQEAGMVSEKVRSFIEENLQLRTEVPALELQDDGELLGGMVGDKDVLELQKNLGCESPGIVVGPDSTPTLSFTSGSEGRPKGVRGRHFSLTYYFPWMSERFHLSQDDRFTMLSGIAHDPIQRDIFTPLFLGAQLLVPSKDDIQHEKLAEWMRRYGATVTHLTPAMGQILVGGATAEFPMLHHAFFVGDILIKRDCRSLQRLAHNVNIVNMYGTTETQRAVSYYEIPSRMQEPDYLNRLGDVIPAGRGMLDVQLLVVDRDNPTQICKNGEVGELYVRAGGLAEDYLGMAETTNQKFLTNWFVDPKKWMSKYEKESMVKSDEAWREFYIGPRDRLYRTGDLGRYKPSGDVECSGRVDNQVKIRGFRIELGDIDTNLSQHPLIRENVTLVRRDKDEEPTLVSYVVPDATSWPKWLRDKGLKDDTEGVGMAGMLRRYRMLRDDARDHLKARLPAYMIPTVIVPLERMPLNPNGKIDKPALPYPDSADLTAASMRRMSQTSAPLSQTAQTLAKIWAGLIKHLFPAAIGNQDSFFDLGGHSILAQQMLFDVRKTWPGIDVSMAAFFQDPTLGGFATEIDRRQTGTNGGGDAVKYIEEDYAADARTLLEKIPTKIEPRAHLSTGANLKPLQVLLTGATGFLGAYILRDLLSRTSPPVKLYALVRAPDAAVALDRVRGTCEAYGVWSSEWTSRLVCLPGNLGAARMGLGDDDWNKLASEVDMVIHNGAWVHWVYPYSRLKASNVQGTIDALQLCALHKPKRFVFVSSTSVLDTAHYVELSRTAIKAGTKGISESDDLSGSSHGLGTGYGQTKWVGEYLVMEAGKRGLSGAIVRPGYITGDSRSGVTNTDDFLIRMAKGCVQLGCRPDIANTVNMVPVDRIARLVVASALYPPKSSVGVVHGTSIHRLTFNQYLSCLAAYGYDVPQVDYSVWRQKLEAYVANGKNEMHALMPLYHFVTGDLPANTIAPELDDQNALSALALDATNHTHSTSANVNVDEKVIGAYFAYLVAVGFLPAPQGNGASRLQSLTLSEEQLIALRSVGGRGALV